MKINGLGSHMHLEFWEDSIQTKDMRAETRQLIIETTSGFQRCECILIHIHP